MMVPQAMQQQTVQGTMSLVARVIVVVIVIVVALVIAIVLTTEIVIMLQEIPHLWHQLAILQTPKAGFWCLHEGHGLNLH